MSKWFEHKGTLYNLNKFHFISCAMCDEFSILLGTEVINFSITICFESQEERDQALKQIRKLLLQTQEEDKPQSRCY